MLTEDFTVEIERLSKGKWKGVHRPGRHVRSESYSPWVRRSALAAIGAGALLIFPLALDTVEKPQFIGPVALGTVPESQLKAPRIIVDPAPPRRVPVVPAKPKAVSIHVFVPIKKPPVTEDSPDPVIPKPPPPIVEEPIEPPPPLPPPVGLPEPVLPPPGPPPSDEDDHHRCHDNKPDPEETNDGDQGQQETPEEDDQHESTGETSPVVDQGTGTEEGTASGE